MLEVIDFDLDNCYVITYDGRLLKQARGIPMGSALSPPLAIGTLAWMEQEWMHTLEDDVKTRFRMKRYMDDVITITAKDDSVWDVDRFREDFRRSECYWAPLKLEAAESDERPFLGNDSRARPKRKLPDETQERERGGTPGVALPSLG